MVYNPADDSLDSNKSISNIELYDPKAIEQLTYKQTLELCKIFIAKKMVPLLFEKGRTEGQSVEQIRQDIEDIVPYRTMMRYAPEWSKAKQIHGPRTKRVDKLSTQAKLADVTPVNIPPPEQPIIIEEEPTPEELAEVAEFNQRVREEVTQPRRQQQEPPAPAFVDPITLPRKHERVRMSLPFARILNGLGPKGLNRLISDAVRDNEDGIWFKINDQGDLYFP
jgi:hypothetical protein